MPRAMFGFLANPARFMAFSRWLAPALGAIAAVLLAAGLVLSFAAPDDYQQGATVRIMFVHVPAAFMATFVYACLGGASLIGLIFRHSLADAAAKAAAPLGPHSRPWRWRRARSGASRCGGRGGRGTRA